MVVCLNCRMSFDRILLSEYQHPRSEPIKGTDLMNFGIHLGFTYRQVYDHQPQYCRWALAEANRWTGDATPKLRRFAMYVEQMEQWRPLMETLQEEVSDDDPIHPTQ